MVAATLESRVSVANELLVNVPPESIAKDVDGVTLVVDESV